MFPPIELLKTGRTALRPARRRTRAMRMAEGLLFIITIIIIIIIIIIIDYYNYCHECHLYYHHHHHHQVRTTRRPGDERLGFVPGACGGNSLPKDSPAPRDSLLGSSPRHGAVPL